VTRIAVDALGGDRGPDEVIAGALAARGDGIEPVLFGPAGLDTRGLELVETSQELEMHEKPAEAVRAKPDSSLVRACRAVGEGDCAAVVSAGNTGAMLAAGLLEIRRLKGVLRPAIGVVIPARQGPSVLIDAGANADARPEQQLQFAHMGAIFAEEILDRPRPEVRILSIGEEAEKGNQLVLEAAALLRESDLHFAGNCESRDLLRGAADVVVCDGFTGNVAL
jgi:glycerol-3-phosphate acyltransferase PlsX